MNKKEIAGAIIEALGGKENITNYTHCVTRLRFNLGDEQRADLDRLENIREILGTTIQGGQYQIIMGTAVNDYYEETARLMAGSKAVGKEKSSKTIRYWTSYTL